MNSDSRTIYENVSGKRSYYNMDTLESINAIPVPADEGPEGEWPVHYVLQRKATEHKRNGNIDLAIACLRKSNELADCFEFPCMTKDDYFRLVKYLQKNGQYDLAAYEEWKIYERHPEFKDKRISNLPRITKKLSDCKQWRQDLVYVTTSISCPICSPYNRQIYSISGKSKKMSQVTLANC